MMAGLAASGGAGKSTFSAWMEVSVVLGFIDWVEEVLETGGRKFQLKLRPSRLYQAWLCEGLYHSNLLAGVPPVVVSAELTKCALHFRRPIFQRGLNIGALAAMIPRLISKIRHKAFGMPCQVRSPALTWYEKTVRIIQAIAVTNPRPISSCSASFCLFGNRMSRSRTIGKPAQMMSVRMEQTAEVIRVPPAMIKTDLNIYLLVR